MEPKRKTDTKIYFDIFNNVTGSTVRYSLQNVIKKKFHLVLIMTGECFSSKYSIKITMRQKRIKYVNA